MAYESISFSYLFVSYSKKIKKIFRDSGTNGAKMKWLMRGSNTSGHIGAVDKVASENQQWEFEQKKRRSLASFRVPYQPLQVQSGR